LTERSHCRLKTKGLVISDKGVSVKTSRRFDQEDYVDATQRYYPPLLYDTVGLLGSFFRNRGFIKAMGAASFGKADPNSSPPTPSSMSPSSPPHSQAGFAMKRKSSSSSAEEKKKGIFGIRKGFSATKEKN